jgi:hypothetical protein
MPLMMIAVLAGCGGGAGSTSGDLAFPFPDGSVPPDLTRPHDFTGLGETPPEGKDVIEEWLAAGSYKAWKCEPAPHPQRPPSAHGPMDRICSNAALSSSTGMGAYPVGAASVKELYRNDQLNGYAVTLRVTAGDGADKWYWYERIGMTVFADGRGDQPGPKGVCVGCHAGAPRDFVFTQVK